MLDWNNVLRIIIPEGSVSQIRHGATVLWNGLNRIAQSLFAFRQSYTATPCSVPGANAQAEQKTELDLIADSTSLEAEQSASTQILHVETTATPIVKPRSTGASTIAHEVVTEAEVASLNSVGAETIVRHRLDLVGAIHALGAAATKILFPFNAKMDGTAHDLTSSPVNAQAVTQTILTGSVAEPESDAVHTAHRETINASGQAVHSASAGVTALYSFMQMAASARTAKEWEYPAHTSSYLVLNRATSAVLYDARSGKNGLEVT